jgi:predicted Fe-S protein YdhL (DUF1289 family)
MAIFPKIQSPCPYKSELAAVMDGDFCRMCRRQVYDLSGWSDGERVAFLASCSDEVCVSYRLPLREMLAAATLASLAAAPAAASGTDSGLSVAALAEGALAVIEVPEEAIWVGGIKDPSRVQYVEHPADAPAPELPVVYEDGPAPAPAADQGKILPPAPVRIGLILLGKSAIVAVPKGERPWQEQARPSWRSRRG